MTNVIRQALVVAAIYFAATYHLDQPAELESDAAAIKQMAQDLPDKGEVSQSVWSAKSRLDRVKGKVEDSIALGAERFSAAN